MALFLSAAGTTPVYKGKYQDVCFTPKKALPRSPPVQTPRSLSSAHHTVTHTPKPALSTPARQPLSPVGANTHTPARTHRHELQRSPPRGQTTPLQRHTGSDSVKSRKDGLRPSAVRPSIAQDTENWINEIPPQKKWEIPRTPLAITVTHTPTPVVTQPPTVTPVVTPASTRSTPTTTTITAPITSAPTSLAASLTPNAPPSSHLSSSDPRDPSPPIPLKPGSVAGLPGLQCNDNDLAYLQRIANVRHYDTLQSQVQQLEKSLKSAAQQKEQLEHEAIKIRRDIAVMRTKYLETVSTVNSLIARSSGVPSDATPTDQPALGSTPQLTSSHMSQVKKAHQLAVAHLERTDNELREKLAEVERERKEMEELIRQKEAAVREREMRQRQSQAKISKERTEWEEKMDAVRREQAMAEEKLHQVQSKLSKASLAVSEDNDRQQTERRLRRVIHRCEMYVERHRMMKEMGLFTSRQKH